MLRKQWSSMVWPSSTDAVASPDTGVDEVQLREVGRASVTIPDGFVRLPALSLMFNW